jgi:hypothetical protein
VTIVDGPLVSQAAARLNGSSPLEPFHVVTLDEFVAVEEPGADPLVGGDDGAVIPEGGDVMFYGDGGAGKTTLCIDLACHLAAGDDWLGLPVTRPARVLLVENEGPRPLFRAKLRRKRDAWAGSALDERVAVLESPWGGVTFADASSREALAGVIRDAAIDVVIVGPVTRSGMNEAGTLQEVRDFMDRIGEVREQSCRRVTFILVHHENKGGQVSGAWEGAGDSLFHVQGQGHGRTRLYVQKARWASSHHATSLQLLWTDGEGFSLEEKPEVNDEAVAELIVDFVRSNPGGAWTPVEKSVSGVGNDRCRDVRDELLRRGQLVNVAKDDAGELVALDHVPERRAAHLHISDDPTIAHLRRESGADPAQAAPPGATGDQLSLRRAPRPKGGAGVGAAGAPPVDPDTEEADSYASHVAEKFGEEAV